MKNYEMYHDSDLSGRDLTMATVVIDGLRLDSAGVRYKSNFSFSIPGNKKPMKIDFNAFIKNRLFQGLRAINLSNEFPDPSMLRNTVAYRIFREAGIKSPHTSFANVFINGTYQGLFVIIEQVDKSFIHDYFENEGGEIIKPLAASLTWNDGDSIALKKNYEIKSKNTEGSWLRLTDFLKRMSVTTHDAFFDSLKSNFDFESYVPVLAADVIFNNWDSYFYGQNYYLYRDTVINKYYYLPWDYNVSMNNYEVSGGDYSILPGDKNTSFFSLPLPSGVMGNKVLRQRYLDELCKINTIMNSDEIKTFISEMHELIKPELLRDKEKIMTNQQYEKSLKERIAISEIEFEGLLSFIERRHRQVAAMLKAEGKICN